MTTQTGILMGGFVPLHLGHLKDINHALGHVDALHIIITDTYRTDTKKSPTLSDKARWLQVAVQGLPSVTVHTVASLDIKSNYDYTKDSPLNQQTLTTICHTLSIKNPVVLSKMGQHPLPRNTEDTLDLLQHVWHYFHHLAPSCRYFYSQTICVVGGESSGKTTLIHKLANHYGASVALEMGRLYADSDLGGTELALQYSDYPIIATNHATAITHAQKNATAPITLIDTDFVTTQAFCIIYEGRSHPIIDGFIDTFLMDHTIYLDNNVAWVADGLRRLGDQRAAFANLLLSLYKKHAITPSVITAPDYHTRYEHAVALIDNWLGKSHHPTKEIL